MTKIEQMVAFLTDPSISETSELDLAAGYAGAEELQVLMGKYSAACRAVKEAKRQRKALKLELRRRGLV